MSIVVAALGDSTSCGEGVGLSVEPHLTWPARLARALPGGELLPLARPGARVHDLLVSQLEPAVEARPHLATVLIGLNDVARGTFEPAAVRAGVLQAVGALRDCGATVLVGRLHDPGRQLRLPARVRESLRRRIAVVNDAVDDAVRAADTGAGGDVHVLDLAQLPPLHARAAWAVDRVHPHTAAHGVLAAGAAAVLARAGLPVEPVHPEPLPARVPGRHDELWWAARHGMPWLAANARDVLLPALAMAR